MQVKPDFAQAYNALGYSFAERNVRISEARRLIDEAHRLAPEDPAILDSVGWVRFREGQYAEALDFLRRAYGKFPDPEVAAHLGEVLWVLGRRDEARTVWRESLAKSPEASVVSDTQKRLDR